MPNAAKTSINEVDQTFSANDIALGISALQGTFKRGPINDPSTVCQSWAQFQKIFGGFVAGVDDPILAKRAFERGTTLRINNVRHYTDPTNKASLSATKAIKVTSKLNTLSAVLVTLNVYTITINGTPVAQAFLTSSDNTQNLLAAKIIQTLPGVVAKAVYLGGGKLIIVPATGITLTVTGVVTLGASQATDTVTSVLTFSNATPIAMFDFVPKFQGADYNNLVVDIGAASSGDANSFDVNFSHLLEPTLNESYKNIKIPGNPSVANSSYLQAIVNGSTLFDVIYLDLSGTTGQQRPVNTSVKYDTGSDGGAIVDADHVGDSGAKTGLYALDGYGDMIEMAYCGESAVVHQAAILYVENRKDMVYYGHLSNTYVNETQLAAAKDALLIDSTYGALYAGGLIIVDPVTSQDRNISEIGDILGASGYCNARFGPWKSFAGVNRGLIFNAKGVVNNFGLDSQYGPRNLLANHEINIVGNVDGKIQIMGGFTTQLASSTLSFLSVRKMLIYLKKKLSPILKRYIEEPDDIPTWKQLYGEVVPVFEYIKTRRGIYDYSWQGDQFAPNITKLLINNSADLALGKYKVKAFVKPIVGIQDISIDIILTPSGVSFEDNLSQLIAGSN